MSGAPNKRTRKRKKGMGPAASEPEAASESWTPLPPNINREDPPAFFRMSPTRFEEMTCSLLEKVPGVSRADLYHTRFDAQYGIDCFGDLAAGIIVASCKCQQKIKKGEMAQWSDDFLDHWETEWKKQGVKKFILSTAAPTEHRNRLVDITTQKQRFASIGVEYEVWSPRQLQEHLRGHRGLVSQYVGGDFVVILCGEEPETPLLNEVLAVQSALENRVENLGSALSGEVEQRFAIAKQILERGAITKAAPLVQSLRDQANWSDLPSDLRARIIRLQASIALSSGDTAQAVAYGDEADAVAPSDEPRLRATIKLYQHGATEALEVLGEPQSEPGRAFKAALFLSQYRLDDAVAVIATLSDTPEKMRLEGLRLLFGGDRTGAKRTADAAMSRAPDNLHIRRLGVMTRYALAFSELAEPQQYAFPGPIASALLRLDDAAVASLREALKLVDDIIALGEPTSVNLDWPWRLACLSNLSDKRPEAAAQAHAILAEDPTNASAIGWILVRGLSVDLKASRDALMEALRDGTLLPNGPRALEWTTEAADRTALLKAVKDALATKSWPNDVRHELEILTGRLGGSFELQGEAASARALDVAISSGQTSAVIAEFQRLRREKPTPILFLASAEQLASMNEWDSLAEGLKELLAFKTADTVRLAAYAAFNSGDALQALSILSENITAFPGARLPYDLRRIEALALARRGEGQKALMRAEALAAETQQLSDRVWEARIRFEVGDLRGAANAIRTSLTLGRIPPQEALWWAQRFAQEDTELARGLWRSAVSSGPLPDIVAASAYHLSFELELEHERPELGAVMPRLAAAGTPGIQVVSIDDLARFITESRERTARLEEMLAKGDIPIHLVAHAANTSLAELYWLGNGTEPALRPVFVRSASRIEPADDRPWDEWILYIDVTGLMIADQLGLLDQVEAHKNRPRIGHSTIPALLSIEEQVRHPQPSRVAAAEAILKEVGRGVRLIPPAVCTRVVHEPGKDELNVAAIVVALCAGGWIDDSTAATARRQLNLTDEPSPIPSAKQAILFAEQTLDMVAGAQLLPAVIAAFDVYIDPDSLELTRAETNRGARSATLITWIGRLRDRISRGLQAGTYLYAEKEVELADDEVKQDSVYVSLLELMRSSETGNANRLWADDRLLNSYRNAGESRVVGVIEILDALRRCGKINDDLYFECLRKLRLGGALFIPATVEEVSRHLTRAQLIGDAIAETPPLTAIRRNLSLALIHQDGLRLGPQQVGGETRPSELPYLMAVRRLLEGVIVDCWNSNSPLPSIQAQCDWVWRSLRMEQPPRPLGGQPPNDPVVFAALNIAGLVSSVLNLKGTRRRGHERRQAYFAWIERSVVNRRFEGDTKLAESVGNLARTLLRIDKADGDFDEASRKMMRDTARRVVYELPPRLQEIVASDEAFRRDLGIEVGGVLMFENTAFFAEEFWDGIQNTINSTPAQVETADRDGLIAIGTASGEWVFPISGAISIKLSEPAAGLLSKDDLVSSGTFAKTVVELDIPLGGVPALRDRLEAAKTANEKMQIISDLRDCSIPSFLKQLTTALQQDSNVQLSRFRPPAAADWLRYLRWQQVDGDALGASLSAAVTELGLDEAARRFTALPITLPREIEQVLEGCAADTLTMMGRIHRLHSLRMSGQLANPVLTDASDEVVQACLEHGGLFLALLLWGAQCFMQQEDWPKLTVGERHISIWCYADKLTRVLLSISADIESTAKLFSDRLRLPPARSLNLEHGYDDNPLLAGAMSQAGILLAGLEFGLSEEADNIKLADTQMERLRAATGVLDDNGVLVCRPERALAFASTPYPTWLSRPTPNAVIENGGQIEHSLAAIVDRLIADPENPQDWGFLIAFGRPVLPSILAEKLEQIVLRVDLKKLLNRDDDEFLALRKVGEVASRLAGKIASDRILNELFALSRDWLADQTSPKFHDHVNALVEAAASASKAYDGSGPGRLSAFLRALIANRAGVAAALRPVLNLLNDDTRVAEAGEFWRALLAARASQ